MNPEQIKAAYRLIQLMDGDPVAQADANQHGDWYKNLLDYVTDDMIEKMELKN